MEDAMEQRAPRTRRRQRDQAMDTAAQSIPQQDESQLAAPEHIKASETDLQTDAALSASGAPATAARDAGFSRRTKLDNINVSKKGNANAKIAAKVEKAPKVPKKPRSPRQHQATEVVHFDSYVQIASTDAYDATPCIYFRAGTHRFMFNASEGVQRVLGQYKMLSLPKINSYFMTRVATSTLAGLPGLLMGANVATAAAASLLGDSQGVRAYGPPGLAAYVNTFLPYAQSAVNCNVQEFELSGEGVVVQLAPLVNAPQLTLTPLLVRPFHTYNQLTTIPASNTSDAAANNAAATSNATVNADADTSNATANADAAASNATANADAAASNATVAANTATTTNQDNAAVKEAVQPTVITEGQQEPGAEDASMKGGEGQAKRSGDEAGQSAETERRPPKRRRMDVLQAPTQTKWTPQETSVTFVVKLLDRPGKFNPKKAASLGVPRGPLYGELQKGKAVLGANGRLVQPEEVMEGATPGPVLIVLDCPSLDYLPSYAHAPMLQPHLGPSVGQGCTAPPLVVVAHVGPLSVVHHADYTEWLTTWGPHCHHMIPTHPAANQQPSYLHRFTSFQAKLNHLDPFVFPLPAALAALVDSNTSQEADANANKAAAAEANANKAAAAEANANKAAAAETIANNAATAEANEAAGAATKGDEIEAGLKKLVEGGSGIDGSQGNAVIHHTGVCARYALYPPQKAGLDESCVPKLVRLADVQRDFSARYTNPPQATDNLDPQTGGTETRTDTNSEATVQSAERMDTGGETDAGGKPDTGEIKDAGVINNVGEIEDARQIKDAGEQAAGGQHAGEHIDGPRANGLVEGAGGGEDMDVDGGRDAVGGGDNEECVPECVRNAARDDLEVVFMGTASAMPGTFRNVSGTLVNMFDRGCMLVDCGEDTWPQVRRRYGEAVAEDLLRRLQLVWVSHMHADHHGGLYPLMQTRRRLLGRSAPPLLIVGPHSLGKVLYNYHKLMPMRYAFLPSPFAERDDLTFLDLPRPTLQAVQRVKEALQLKSMRTFPVDHGCAAHGLQLHSQRGWRVVFSGDTQPCESVRRAAEGATLLVHEATFEDALVHEARMRHHCTISEALKVARQAGVYRVALTHFSQRYPKLPSSTNSEALERAFFAFDHASINLADLPRLPKLIADWDHLCECLTADDQELVVPKDS